ncbi:MAG TPA: DUF433 domain-containing protein [Bryobacteraceae bacterium]|jgi:uncharacterized protein (DUF433 family)|nr:DUF433 domain-containing protein [Bryobacteraceae bacterium]
MEYVEQRNGGYYVAGTRVSLDSVVYAYLRGESPEGIAYEFQALTLDQINNALTFYLANRPMVDEYLRQGEIEYDRLYEEARAKDPDFYSRLDAAREAARSHRNLGPASHPADVISQ